MKYIFLLFLLGLAGCSSQKSVVKSNHQFQTVFIDTILKEKISIRAIAIDKSKVWYAADKGRFGFYDISNGKRFESKISKGQSEIEFRSIAQTPSSIFVLNVGNPALLYRISKEDLTPVLMYEEIHEKVFYDSMQFWNATDGIAIGDPITDCLSVLLTNDGGNSWQKIPCNSLPKIVDGEAAFAASNTNVIVKGNKTWIVSGGKKSRVFYSPDQAKTWQIFETPIVQGASMTGVFTADFYDEKTGFIAGGNYDVPESNSKNKAITINGGKNWETVAEDQGFGYASCVQFVPGSNGKQLVCVGATGLHYSADAGKTWIKLMENKELYTIRFLDPVTAIAAGHNIMLKLSFK